MEADQTGAHQTDALMVERLIGRIYDIEARLRIRRASPKLRAVTRQAESRPIIDRIGTILTHWKKRRRHLPQSQMGKAIDYTLTEWNGLRVYLEDGRVEIDNNEAENAIRHTAVGKKKWLFIGDAEAGERRAIVFTVIEACRRRGVDPFEYLRDVFTRMPQMAAKDYSVLAPAAWAADRQPVKLASKVHAVHKANALQRHWK